jgi:hypothetical protein
MSSLFPNPFLPSTPLCLTKHDPAVLIMQCAPVVKKDHNELRKHGNARIQKPDQHNQRDSERAWQEHQYGHNVHPPALDLTDPTVQFRIERRPRRVLLGIRSRWCMTRRSPPVMMLLLRPLVFRRIHLVSRLGLSTKLEALEAATTSWETSGTSTGREAGVAGKSATTTTHHVEQDFGVDAAHSTAHTAHAATREHVGRIHKIVAAVVTSSLPIRRLAYQIILAS